MAYGGDPSASDLDHVRFLIGDTTSNPDLADAEINYELTKRSNVYLAASYCALRLAAEASKKIAFTAGSVVGQRSQVRQHYTELAKDLRREALLKAGSYMKFTARTKDEKDTRDENVDLVQPLFKRDPVGSDEEADRCD